MDRRTLDRGNHRLHRRKLITPFLDLPTALPAPGEMLLDAADFGG
jgi:hypothetical protein